LKVGGKPDGILLSLFDHKDTGDRFLRNIGRLSAGYMAFYPICRFPLDVYCSENKEEIYHGRRFRVCPLLHFALGPCAMFTIRINPENWSL
jgi:hypothetical protein